MQVYVYICVWIGSQKYLPPPPQLLSLAHYFEAKKGKELLLNYSIHVVQTSLPLFFMILNTCEVDSHDNCYSFLKKVHVYIYASACLATYVCRCVCIHLCVHGPKSKIKFTACK